MVNVRFNKCENAIGEFSSRLVYYTTFEKHLTTDLGPVPQLRPARDRQIFLKMKNLTILYCLRSDYTVKRLNQDLLPLIVKVEFTIYVHDLSMYKLHILKNTSGESIIHVRRTAFYR